MVSLLFNILGSIGLILLLVGFYIEESNKFKGHKLYSTINLIGSFLLILYAWQLRGWVFVILNAIWMIVAIYYLIRGR